MSDQYTMKAGEYGVFNQPELSEWTCYLFGNTPDSSGIVWTPVKGKHPNWFWRKMQYICFGNMWRKS